MNTPAHHDKNIIALVIMAIAFVIFLLFNNYQPFLEQSNSVPKFVVLAAFALALLLILFFLVSQRTDTAVRTKSSKKKKK